MVGPPHQCCSLPLSLGETSFLSSFFHLLASLENPGTRCQVSSLGYWPWPLLSVVTALLHFSVTPFPAFLHNPGNGIMHTFWLPFGMPLRESPIPPPSIDLRVSKLMLLSSQMWPQNPLDNLSKWPCNNTLDLNIIWGLYNYWKCLRKWKDSLCSSIFLPPLQAFSMLFLFPQLPIKFSHFGYLILLSILFSDISPSSCSHIAWLRVLFTLDSPRSPYLWPCFSSYLQ